MDVDKSDSEHDSGSSEHDSDQDVAVIKVHHQPTIKPGYDSNK